MTIGGAVALRSTKMKGKKKKENTVHLNIKSCEYLRLSLICMFFFPTEFFGHFSKTNFKDFLKDKLNNKNYRCKCIDINRMCR